jgi:uncharacterized protein
MLEDEINRDLKAALLGGDKPLATTLRGLKSSILYAKIADNSRDKDMPDGAIIAVLQKEAKKRQESADLYRQGGSAERADAELQEKRIIEEYLPAPLSEAELTSIIDDAVGSYEGSDDSALGGIIKIVKEQTAGRADGAQIARIVKERLSR